MRGGGGVLGPGSWVYPVVRVHWNGPSLPVGVVPAQLKQYGEIISDVFEESVSRKFPGELTGVRKFVFCVKDRARFDAGVPHLLCLVFDGVQYRLFVVVSGKSRCACAATVWGISLGSVRRLIFVGDAASLVIWWASGPEPSGLTPTGLRGGGGGSLWCCGGEYGDLE